MISFDSGEHRFNFRASGVAIRPADGRILLFRTIRDPFWSLPGGRCELGETGAEALSREIQEEIGVTPHVGRLLFVGESFFTYGRLLHELNFIYAMELPLDSGIYEHGGPFPGFEPDLPLVYEWVNIQDVRNGSTLPVFPTFLKDALSEPLARSPRHVIGREADGTPGEPLAKRT